jgi:UDP-N-acetylglucosamine--N-acetylmuramyl-(pentapeptide) pyrophosphoryl-undecaprenol N-acetylglucosamine transferase
MTIQIKKIIIGGGGTGGHIFPALSIADEVKHRYPDAEILFIGAEDRMEMERVPAAGYKIRGLPVCGFDRSKKLKDAGVVIWKFIRSVFRVQKIIRRFKPDIVIGVGGYASGPTLWVASLFEIPTILQEQNSCAGITNRFLGRTADKICVAYRGMEKYFPADKIVLTGNPVRKDLFTEPVNRDEALGFFGLEDGKPVLLVIGGSLGARTINDGVKNNIQQLLDNGIQVIWQTGKHYYDSIKEAFKDLNYKGLWISGFISRMDYAYAVADLVISRAGAGTISELSLMKKPVILVPSPNVSEDHQTVNARALCEHDAAILITDAEFDQKLIPETTKTLKDKDRLKELSEQIGPFSQGNSAERILDEAEKVISNRR